MSALVLEAVSKRFGGVIAADNVDMNVPAGSITGLIGPNGAGKTTLINLITGMLPLSAGRICFGAADLSKAPAHEVGRAGIARTFQNIRLLAEATALENVMIGFQRLERCSNLASLFGLPSAHRETRDVRTKALALLGRFSMTRYADYPAGGLAYGHQRRIEMMRALAGGPDLLLLDEPVAGMNDVEAGELARIFAGLADGGMGILLIEHNIRFVSRLCRHVYVLDGGRVIAEGSPREVTDHPAVVAAYLGA